MKAARIRFNGEVLVPVTAGNDSEPGIPAAYDAALANFKQAIENLGGVNVLFEKTSEEFVEAS